MILLILIQMITFQIQILQKYNRIEIMRKNEDEQMMDLSTIEVMPSHLHKSEKPSLFRRFGKLIAIVLILGFINFSVIMLLNQNHSQSQIQKLTVGSLENQEAKITMGLPLEQKTSESKITAIIEESKIQELKPLDLRPFYIWLGDMPQKQIDRLKSFKYQFRLIRDCDMLLAKMEGELLEKFNREVYETVNIKSDVCRFITLYYYGGLYLDMDTKIDLPCLNDYLKDKRIFFEATPKGGVDIFAIYSSQPYDPEILEAIKSYNTYNSYFKSYCAMTLRISQSAKTIAKSGCIKHIQEGAWRPLLPSQQPAK